MRSILYAVVFFLMSAGTTLADYDQAKDWFYSKDWRERIRVQFLLVFTGDYTANVDGAFGRQTYNALTAFQNHRNYPADGVLPRDQMLVLQRDGFDLIGRVGFESHSLPSSGIKLGIPVKLFNPPTPREQGQYWHSYDGSIDLETLRVAELSSSYDDLFRKLSTSGNGRSVAYKKKRNDFFVVSGEEDGRAFYIRIMKTPKDSRGFSLSWEKKHAVFMDRVAVAMSNSMTYFDGGSDAMAAEVADRQTGKGDRLKNAQDVAAEIQ